MTAELHSGLNCKSPDMVRFFRTMSGLLLQDNGVSCRVVGRTQGRRRMRGGDFLSLEGPELPDLSFKSPLGRTCACSEELTTV
mgnify:CR=1 FL=1